VIPPLRHERDTILVRLISFGTRSSFQSSRIESSGPRVTPLPATQAHQRLSPGYVIGSAYICDRLRVDRIDQGEQLVQLPYGPPYSLVLPRYIRDVALSSESVICPSADFPAGGVVLFVGSRPCRGRFSSLR